MSVYTNYDNRLGATKKVLYQAQGERRAIQQELVDCSSAIALCDTELDTLQKTMIFLQNVSVAARTLAKERIEEVVSSALKYVYGAEYALEIIINSPKSGPEADFYVAKTINGTKVLTTPTMSNGGGIVDIVSAAVKFALLELLNCDGIICLDEPFKQISKEYIADAGKLLEYMCTSSGRQLIFVTHNDVLANMCGAIQKFKLVGGYSEVIRN